MVESEIPRGPIARTVREALDAVVSPEVGERVLSAALMRSQLADVPEDPDRFKAFLAPFRVVAEESLGEETTSLLFEELHHLAERAITSRLPPRNPSKPRVRGRISSPPTRPSSQPPAAYRRARESDAPGAPHFRLTPQRIQAIPRLAIPDFGREAEPRATTPPDSADLPRGMARAMGLSGSDPNLKPASRVIVLCSTDAKLERGVASWVSGRAKVLVCNNLFGLVSLLGGDLPGRVVVFVDCRQPTLRPMSLAALSDDLPSRVDVVLWGATPALVNDLTQLFASTRQWMVCAPTLAVEAAIERCVQLMG
ncbi:MAG: hypothetical protein SFV15_00440 [Polyangiaceae bacterium]|nr:hypothetical protein [Polyangiaceae bacterium]